LTKDSIAEGVAEDAAMAFTLAYEGGGNKGLEV
jgi:hypothetical protein